jgi:hypothetical protein
MNDRLALHDTFGLHFTPCVAVARPAALVLLRVPGAGRIARVRAP